MQEDPVMDIDILLYVEDPGAANYVAHIPSALAERGLRVRLLAEEIAYTYLLHLGVEADLITHPLTADQLFSQWKPKQVVVGTSENTETFAFDLLGAAKKRGMITVGAVDASGNVGHRFRGNTGDPLYHAPDWLIVPDQWTKDAYVSLGYPSGRIAVCGHPLYDYVYDMRMKLEVIDRIQLRKRLFPDCRKGIPVVVFVSEVSTGLNPDQYQMSSDYTLKGRGDKKDRTGIVLEEFLDAIDEFKPRPYLVLRMHPKNTRVELSPFLKDFDRVSQHEPPLEVVYVADLVVGMTTMLMQESVIMGRPTLSIVPRSVETRSLATVRAGITPCVTKRKELRKILPRLLNEAKITKMNQIETLFQYGSLRKTVTFIEGLLHECSH